MTATRSTGDGPGPSDQYVQSLVRGLNVIRAFDEDHPEMTLSEIAAATSLTRATARRFLSTLVEVGYMKSHGRWYSLTPRVLELGFSYLSSLSLPEVAQPYLERLSQEIDESSSVSVLDGSDIVYVARATIRRRIMSVTINIGTRLPAHLTAMGRVLLAAQAPEDLSDYLRTLPSDAPTERAITDPAALRTELDLVREQGFSLIDQEVQEGLRSIAVPVLGRRQHSVSRNSDTPPRTVIAAVNVSTSASSLSRADIVDRFLDPLRRTSAAIADDLEETRRGRG
ncbi:IclR family transcriptional regulator C-terminal domain-containing protein [Amycolatopsis halotolerans]|uniref:IclR family transcriptional regulator C-terminal domain-containing protein n=1 Tax=Amycolatopsis halotolerans TaxID=330083 RepID=A0ABV7QHY6_9PSEU